MNLWTPKERKTPEGSEPLGVVEILGCLEGLVKARFPRLGSGKDDGSYVEGFLFLGLEGVECYALTRCGFLIDPCFGEIREGDYITYGEFCDVLLEDSIACPEPEQLRKRLLGLLRVLEGEEVPLLSRCQDILWGFEEAETSSPKQAEMPVLLQAASVA